MSDNRLSAYRADSNRLYVAYDLEDGTLGAVPVREITSRGTWIVRVVAVDGRGNQREARGTLTVD